MQTSIGVILIVVSCYMIGEIYKIGVPSKSNYKVIFNSDDIAYGGEGRGQKDKIKWQKEEMHGFSQCISLDLPPMSTIYLKKTR